MANPVAAHTFDFLHIYLSTRTGGAPGSGAWSDPVVIFDTNSDTTDFYDATTFSAGGLQSTDPYGILSQTDSEDFSITDLAFLGNGSPTAPLGITFSGQQGALSSSQGYWNTSQGAFQQGSSLFMATVDHGKVKVLASADGSSPWAVQDFSDGPTGSGSAVALQRVDNYLFFFMPTGGGANFAIYPFNMTTGLWESASTAISLSNFSSFGIGGETPTPWTNGVVEFINGNFLILYNATGNSCKAFLLTGGLSGTWGSAITLPGQMYANCVIAPTPNILYILTYDTTGDPTSEVHYSTIDQDGTLTSDITQIPSSVGGSDGVGHCSIQNGMIFVPRDDVADSDNAIWVASLPVSAFSKEALPVPAGEANAIILAGPNPAANSGYMVGDTGTVNGGLAGFLAGYTIDAIHNNIVNAYTYGSPNLGTGYAPGDIGTIAGGSPTLAQYQVLTVGAGGSVDTLQLINLGSGYSTGLAATTATTGIGTGLEIDVVSVINGVSEVTISPLGGGYTVANNVGTTTGGTQPGAGTGLEINILAVGGKKPSCAYMMFPNGYSLGPPPLTLACPVNNTATIGVPYSGQLVASGGTPPYTFSIIS